MPTVQNTDPDFILNVDRAQREIGIGLDTIVAGRSMMGIDRPLLDDVAPPITASFTPAGSEESTEVEIR